MGLLRSPLIYTLGFRRKVSMKKIIKATSGLAVVLYLVTTCANAQTSEISENNTKAIALAEAVSMLGLMGEYAALERKTCMFGSLAEGKNGNPQFYKPSWVFQAMKNTFGNVSESKRDNTYLNNHGKSTDSWTSEVSFYKDKKLVFYAWYDIRTLSDGTMCIGGMFHSL